MASSSPRVRSSQQVRAEGQWEYGVLLSKSQIIPKDSGEYGFHVSKSQIIPTVKSWGTVRSMASSSPRVRSSQQVRVEGQWGVWLPPPQRVRSSLRTVGSMASSSPRVRTSLQVRVEGQWEYGFLLPKSQIIPTGKSWGTVGSMASSSQKSDHPNR